MSKLFLFPKGKIHSKMTDADFIINKDVDLNKDIIEAFIREAFNMFDEDGSGEIDYKEFKKLIKSLGYNWSNEKIAEIIRQFDTNQNGLIEIEEFTDLMLTNLKNEDSSVIKIHLENTFNLYDKDQDGIISIEDLINVSKDVEDILESEEASLIISFTKILCFQFKCCDRILNGINKDEFFLLLYNLGFIEEKNPNKSAVKLNNILLDIPENCI